MINETKRDLHADLTLCEKAERWDSGYIESVTDVNFAKYIAAAREGWPHAIERAIAAEGLVIAEQAKVSYLEKTNAAIRADLLQSSRVLYEAQRYIDELEEVLKREGRLIERAAKILEHAVPAYSSAEWLRDYEELRGDDE